MSKNEKTCPSCATVFYGDEEFCTLDGSPLSSSSPRRSPAARLPKETVAGILVVVVLLAVVGGVLLVRQSRQFRLKVVFDGGCGLNVGDHVYVESNQAGSIVDRHFEGENLIATITVRPDAVPLLQTNSTFYVATENVMLNKKCIAVFRDVERDGVPLEAGQTVAGESKFVNTLIDVRAIQMKQFFRDFRERLGIGQ
jgi:hypothetical protein